MSGLGSAVLAALGKVNWLWEHSAGWILKWLLIIIIRGYQLT